MLLITNQNRVTSLRTHSFIIVIRLDIMNDVAEVGFAKRTVVGDLSPLHNACKTEGMCSLGQEEITLPQHV